MPEYPDMGTLMNPSNHPVDNIKHPHGNSTMDIRPSVQTNKQPKAWGSYTGPDPQDSNPTRAGSLY